MNSARTPLYLRLEPDLYNALKEQARVEKVSLNQHARTLLEEALRTYALLPGTKYLLPEIKEVLSKYLYENEEKATRILLRTAIEVGATKRLLMHLIVALDQASEEEVDDLEKQAWKLSRDNLYAPLKSLEELLQETRASRSASNSGHGSRAFSE